MSTLGDPLDFERPKPRDRRQSARVPLGEIPRDDRTSACRLTDISAGGVGFLAPRSEAPVLDDALLLVHVGGGSLCRAVVQRVDLGGPSEEWVRVGARFVDPATDASAVIPAQSL